MPGFIRCGGNAYDLATVAERKIDRIADLRRRRFDPPRRRHGPSQPARPWRRSTKPRALQILNERGGPQVPSSTCCNARLSLMSSSIGFHAQLDRCLQEILPWVLGEANSGNAKLHACLQRW